MMRMNSFGVLVALVLTCGAGVAQAQTTPDDSLRREVERRFDVLPLRDGVALHPKTPMHGIRSVEITGGTIALDGQPATGAELREKLGPDADRIFRLSYLDDAARRALFGGAAASGPASPSLPDTPALPREPSATAPDIDTPTPPDPPRRSRRSDGERRNGDRVRIGGSVHVRAGEVIDGDVVAVGGSVTVDGEVHGDVVSVGGSVTLGPDANVARNVVVVGGTLQRDPGAQIGGKAQEVALPGFRLEQWSWRNNPVGSWWRSMLGSAFAFAATLARVAVLCLLVALVVLFGQGSMERAGRVAASSTLKAGAVGFLAQIFFLPVLIITVVVMVMTVIGIPLLLLLPFAILALAVVGLIGFTGVAHYLGALVARQLGWMDRSPYVLAVMGVVLVMLPVLLSRLASLGGGLMRPFSLTLAVAGFVIEYVVWTVGFGAVALMRYKRDANGRTGEASPAV